MINTQSLTAANAYQNSQKMLQGFTDTMGDTDGATSGGGFASMLGDALKSAADTQYSAEALKMQSVSAPGKVELTDLITAVSNAELSLNTVVAVRDKVISAYQDIIRMAI